VWRDVARGTRQDVSRWPLRRATRGALMAAVLLAGLGVTYVAAAGTDERATAGTDERAAATTTVAAAADTYVVQESPSQAFGTTQKLAASNWSTPWHSQAYLRFAVPAPPSGQVVTSAALQFTFQTLDHQASTVELRAVASTDWPEATTTYANRPALGAVLATTSITAQGTTTMSFDVTSAVKGASGVRSFALTNPTAESAAVVYSREATSGAPRLVLGYGTGPAPAGTLCGASFEAESGETYKQALVREDNLFGGLGAVRIFNGGMPPAWPGPLDLGTRPSVVSFKANPKDINAGKQDAYLSNWFATSPRDRDVYWTFYHEPEDNIASGEFTAADYRTAWQRLSGLARAAGNPRLHATMVLMEWTLNSGSGRNWRDYYPGNGVLDVLAWDVYNYDSQAAKGVYVTPASLLDHIVSTNASVGLPYGVAEMGSHIAKGDDGTKRAAWVRSMNQYLTGHGSLWNLWFDINWSTGDYRLRDAAGLAAWRDLCA
jgi:hypothetical protein